jgi:hypothetical protein
MFLDEKKLGEQKVVLEPWRQALFNAADYIDEHGWCQGKIRDCDGSVCALGAIFAVGSLNEGGQALSRAGIGAIVHMSDYINDGSRMIYSIESWNDMHIRTKDDVTSALRGCAKSGE